MIVALRIVYQSSQRESQSSLFVYLTPLHSSEDNSLFGRPMESEENVGRVGTTSWTRYLIVAVGDIEEEPSGEERSMVEVNSSTSKKLLLPESSS